MIISGLDEYAVTLTQVPGIGPKMAKRLESSGVAYIEELAKAEASSLSDIRGISVKRAIEWINEAKRIALLRTAFVFRETAPKPKAFCQLAASDIDPYRFRRALDLKVVGSDGNQFLVTGGLEPHRVQIQTETFRCDCGDFTRNETSKHCKHILAVRLLREDPEAKCLANDLAYMRDDTRLDLFQLWSSKSRLGPTRTIV
jgi:hypothetical protein